MRRHHLLAASQFFFSSRRQLVAYLIKSVLVLLLTTPACGQRETKYARVERVVDGDTVILAGLGRARLIGVDTPESVQPGQPVEFFGREAARFSDRHLKGRRVEIQFDDQEKDTHNRFLVYLFLDGELFNIRLVREGYGAALTRFPFKRETEFLRADDEARTSRRGMWARIPGQGEVIYRGNSGSSVYHSPWCEHYDCRNCTIELLSREIAEDKGFTPHWACVGSTADQD